MVDGNQSEFAPTEQSAIYQGLPMAQVNPVTDPPRATANANSSPQTGVRPSAGTPIDPSRSGLVPCVSPASSSVSLKGPGLPPISNLGTRPHVGTVRASSSHQPAAMRVANLLSPVSPTKRGASPASPGSPSGSEGEFPPQHDVALHKINLSVVNQHEITGLLVPADEVVTADILASSRPAQ